MNIYAPRYTNAGDASLAATPLLVTTAGIGVATNNAFYDDSPTNFLPTRYGDTTQGTFSPFSGVTGSTDPTAVGGSVWFDGSGDSVSAPNSAANFGSGNFTAECWQYFTTNSIGYQPIMGNTGTADYQGWIITTETNNYLYCYFTTNGSSWTHSIATSYQPTVNVWTHLALVRNGTTITLYANGVSIGSTTIGTGTIHSPSGAFYAGYYPYYPGGARSLTGYISNLRLVNGTAVYTANFTPSPAPLTAVANTSLLTCQSATTITDASTNAFTVTRVGDARPNTFTPFGYGSTYFDGGTTYISAADNAALQMGSGDFTVELWWFPTTLTGYQTLFDKGYNTAGGLALQTSSASLSVVIGGAVPITAGAFVANTWHHIAVTRSGSTVTLYVNGISVGTGTSSATLNSTHNLGIGASTNQTGNGYYPATGYISNVRVVKGTGVYPTAFTPPTAPLTAISGTSLLALTCSCRTADDSSNGFIFTRYGGVRVTKETPFAPKATGYWSAYFNGSTDYQTIASPAGQLGSGDFTVEAWVYPTARSSTYPAVWHNYSTWGAGAFGIYAGHVSYSTKYTLAVNGTHPAVLSNSDIIYNRWTHLAAVRRNGVITLYVNGIAEGTYSTSAALDGAGTAWIAQGGDVIGSSYFTGYISNVRVMKGIAAYATNFTPPVAPLTATAGTSLLAVQGNRFRDNSPNNFAITQNGNASVGKFSPFPQTVTPSVTATGSTYFDGSGDYLTISDNAALRMGTGDFTIEFWWLPQSGSYKTPFDKGYNGAGGLVFQTNNTTADVIDIYSAGVKLLSANTAVRIGAWNHIALVRSGTTMTLYQNGISVATATNSTNFSSTSNILVGIDGSLGAASQFAGYLSNLRIVKGAAIYTAAFTPPTSVLTAVADTSLLTCQSASSVTDASTNNFTVTKVGDAKAVEASPFKRVTYPYSGSGYFDGTGDYVSVPPNANLLFGTGDFTIDFWVYPQTTSAAVNQIWVVSPGGAERNGVAIGMRNGYMWWLFGNGSSWVFERNAGTALSINTWSHVAVTRASGTARFFVNGVLIDSLADTTNINQGTSWTVGGYGGVGYYLTGYMSNIRFVKGVAVYTTNFTPPTAPVPAIGGTGLLLNFDNALTYDTTGRSDLRMLGTAKTSTSYTKWGKGSIALDGTASCCVKAIADYPLGTGDFTIEMWFNLTSMGTYPALFDWRPASTSTPSPCIMVSYGGANKLTYYMGTATAITGTTNIATGTWYHAAVCRASGVTRLFLNGVQEGSSYTDTNNYTGPNPVFGALGYDPSLTAYCLNGFLEDIRVTRSARYTANFTPPTGAFASTSLPSSMSSTRTSEMVRSSLF